MRHLGIGQDSGGFLVDSIDWRTIWSLGRGPCTPHTPLCHASLVHLSARDPRETQAASITATWSSYRSGATRGYWTGVKEPTLSYAGF